MATRMWQALIETPDGDVETDLAKALIAVAGATGYSCEVDDVDGKFGIWNIEVPDEVMSAWILDDTRGPLGEVKRTSRTGHRITIPLG